MSISIDICNTCIKIIDGEEKLNKIKINKVIKKDFDMPYIENGYIINTTDFTLFLTDLVNEYNLKNKECYLTINSTDIISKEVMLPKTKNKNIKKLINNSIKELFGETLNLCIDYQICEEVKKDNKDFYRIVIYAIPLKMMQDYKIVINNSGLLPKSLDIKANCISKILNYKINNENVKDNVILFIDISQDNMNLSLMNGGILLYKRDLDISEDIKREKMFLNKENEEEDFLSEVAITDNKNSDEITFLDEQDYFKEEAMFTSPILIRVYEEINKIVQFSMSLENVNIDRVYLYGDRENLEEIADYISDNIIFKSQKIANISDLLLNEEIDITKFFIAIGNVLRK